jgi:hypothetical protein
VKPALHGGNQRIDQIGEEDSEQKRYQGVSSEVDEGQNDRKHDDRNQDPGRT